MFDSVEEFISVGLPAALMVVVALAFNLPSKIRNFFN